MCFISGSLMAQKINLDTLSVDQLNLYKAKAVTMRNTGRVLTISGAGVFATGFVAGIIMMNTPGNGPPEDPHGNLLGGFFVICLGGLVGVVSSAIGIPLWAAGGSRKAKAELTLQKFNIAPKNSMAAGLGITLRF
jgi:hypothetical protein